MSSRSNPVEPPHYDFPSYSPVMEVEARGGGGVSGKNGKSPAKCGICMDLVLQILHTVHDACIQRIAGWLSASTKSKKSLSDHLYSSKQTVLFI